MSGAGLGTNTKDVSTSAKEGRRRRWKLQDVAGELLPSWRVAWCGKKMTGSQVTLVHSGEHRKAYYKGVAVCGSVWTCPVCASRISEGRRLELQDAVNRKGFTKVLVTFTLQHDRNDSLAQLVDALNDSIRRLKMGRWWLDTKRHYGIVGYVTASEFTYGVNGWHPHKHMLMFLDVPEDEIDTESLQAHLTGQYQQLLARHGRYASDFYGVDVQVGDERAGNYVSKWGIVDEVTKANTKKGREGGKTPFQLLEEYQNGDRQAGALFVEYANVTKGKSQLNWGRGTKKALGLMGEKTDIELAEEPEEVEIPQVLVSFDAFQWREILRQKLRLQLLEVADGGNIQDVLDFLETKGVMNAGARAPAIFEIRR